VDKLLEGPIPPPYDVVLMDLQMPVMDGHQATAKIRGDARFAAVPIYAMTAHATLEERDRCLARGMQGHIAKPIDPALLFSALGKLAGRVPEAGTSSAATEAVEPVPIASADQSTLAGADQSTLDLPAVDGLDTADGLRRVGGNRKLYQKLLRQFASSQASAGAQIRAALETGDIESATRQAHTLKGVAGSLGAGPVQAAAAAVEELLRDGSPAMVDWSAPASAIHPALEQLAVVLDPFLARLRAALAADATAEPAVAAVAPEQTRAVAEKLTKLFADFDASAIEFTEENQASLRPAFDAGAWEQFLRQVQGFAFADAGVLLEQALAHLPAS
jgi:two-component system sensor histidine kinase/response regulator